MTTINKQWVLDFTGLENDENFVGFSIHKGVLRITLRESVVAFRVDFMLFIEREIEGFRHATVEFDLPLPECITPNGEEDFQTLYEVFSGPQPEFLSWRERTEVQDCQELMARHERNLSSGGDL